MCTCCGDYVSLCSIVLKLLKKVEKGAKIRNRYNHAPHLTQDTNGKVTNSQLDITNDSQEVSSFPAGDHKAKGVSLRLMVNEGCPGVPWANKQSFLLIG